MTEAQRLEKWMRHAFDTRNAHQAWKNACLYFEEKNISVSDAPGLQYRFMRACYDGNHDALEALIVACNHDLPIHDGIMPAVVTEPG